MKHTHEITAAEERLLDAALEQYFAGVPAIRRRAIAPRLRIAALLWLGLAVTAATMWYAHSAQRDEAQDPLPASLPIEVVGDGKSHIERLPVDTENLLAKLVDPRDLPVIARFERLRRLSLWAESVHVAGIDTRKRHPMWSEPPVDLLAPVAALRHLEWLAFPRAMLVTPALLAPLAGHPSLQELTLVGSGVKIDETLAAALAAIPRLRRLHLHFVDLDGATLTHLARLPLVSLRLEFCAGLDANGWQSLLTMRDLESLSFKDWAWDVRDKALRSDLQNGTATEPVWRPTAEDVRRLASLPKLLSLEVLGCGLDDEQLAALPDRLTELRLIGSKLTPDGIGGMRQFLALRELTFDTKPGGNTIADLFAPDAEPPADAFAAALSSLRLQSLDYRGALSPDLAKAIAAQTDLRDLRIRSKAPADDTAATLFGGLRLRRLAWHAPVTAELLEALAAQRDLRELELHAGEIGDIAPLAAAARLEHLTLTETSVGEGVSAAVLAPLARSTTLLTIVVNESVVRGEVHASEAELQRAVGDRIRVHLHRSEFARNR